MNRPPKVKPAARAGAAGDRAQARDHTAKDKGGRPPVQGNRTGRNACQPAPTWEALPGAAAAADIAHALRGWTAIRGEQPLLAHRRRGRS